MHRLPRLAGLGIILGLLGWSFQYSWNQLSHPDTDGRPVETATDDDQAVDEMAGATSEDGSAPEYLSFAGVIPSGRYSVADLPDNSDWDYGERGGQEPEPSHISADNPVAERLPVVDNDYVTPPVIGGDSSEVAEDPGDSDDSDDSEDAEDFGRRSGQGERGKDGSAGDEARDALPSILPGVYATDFGVVDCEYELRRIMDDNRDHVIGHDRIEGGRMMVSINEVEPDMFVATESCGEWAPWSPLVDPLTVAGTGDYWIGDLAQGIWSVPPGCYWEKVVSFRGALLLDVEDTGVGPATLTIDQFTLGVRVRHCGGEPLMWTDDLPPGPPIEDLEAAQDTAHRAPVRTDPEISGSRSSRRRRR